MPPAAIFAMNAASLAGAVVATLGRWEREQALHACRLMRQGASAQLVLYPTGLKRIRVTSPRQPGSAPEVTPEVFERMRADGWTLRDATPQAAMARREGEHA